MIRAEHGRYLLGGGLCALLNNVILIGGDRLGYGYGLLTCLTFLITGTVAYRLHCWFTFRRVGRWDGYLQYMAGIALGVPVTLLLLALLCSLLGLPMWIAAPVLTVLMLAYNYANARLAIVARLFGGRSVAKA
jgi:putative flippase GtrA